MSTQKADCDPQCVQKEKHDSRSCVVPCRIDGCVMKPNCFHYVNITPEEVCKCGIHNTFGTIWIGFGDEQCLHCDAQIIRERYPNYQEI